ncbi:MAG: C40 family peptidase [Comamonadaceae bacterium]|nr:C40 family peptidase [Comamonadaceae bacterium]
MVGKPYRYGGNSPRGFDCSGLVYFSYQRAGMSVPRTTDSQRARSRKVSMSRVSQGDLLFFNQEGRALRACGHLHRPRPVRACTVERKAGSASTP